jgi:hypothetical protein
MPRGSSPQRPTVAVDLSPGRLPSPSDPAERSRIRAEIDDLAARLVSAYSGRLPAGAVRASVTRCTTELRRAGTRGHDVTAMLEKAVRAQLDRSVPPHSDPAAV